MKKQPSFDSKVLFLPISAAAKLLGVHQRTLRIYDEEGILVPERTEGNRRHYSLNDIEKARAIQLLTRNMGLNLSGVKFILACFEKMKIRPQKYIDSIEKLAVLAKIDLAQQKINAENSARRGRPKV